MVALLLARRLARPELNFSLFYGLLDILTLLVECSEALCLRSNRLKQRLTALSDARDFSTQRL